MKGVGLKNLNYFRSIRAVDYSHNIINDIKKPET